MIYLRSTIGRRALSLFGIIALCGSMQMYSQAPSGYYSSLEGKSGTELKAAVKAIGKKGFSAISYGTDTWTAFKKTDVHSVNGVDCWWDMYSSNNVAVSSGHSGLNIEHSVANSWWGGTKNNAYKDIVHLNPSNSDANSRKSNYPLGKIETGTWDNGVTFVGKPASGDCGGATYVYEPADEYKGDFARVFMYMFTIYDDITWKTSTTNWMYDTTSELTLKPWAYNLLLEWSANDPVSAKEVSRNNGVASQQGNRNPFIDLPDLADYIWGSKRGEAYHVDGDHTQETPETPTEPETPETPTEPETPSDPTEADGTYMLVSSQTDIATGYDYVIVSATNNIAMSTNQNDGSTYFSGSGEVSPVNNTITNLPEGTAIITLENNGSGYSIKVKDMSGNVKGYLCSTAAKNVTLTSSSTASGATADISVSGSVTDINFGSKIGSLYYNANAPRFTTYTSSQESLQLYRYIKNENTGIEEVTDTEDDSFLVEVWGNNILVPEGAHIYDLNGREITGENVSKGIYIVAKPTFKQAVKVMVK